MKISSRALLMASAALLIGVSTAMAGEADVVDVRITPDGDGTYRFDVTVRHDDEGWEHYADAFEILKPQDRTLGRRVLHHPHVDEQPFTRSLSGVAISSDIEKVIVRAHDSVHGYGGNTMTVTVPR